MANRADKTVHALRRGFPVCNFTKHVASRWPEGHTSVPEAVALSDAHVYKQINCGRCKDRLEPSFAPAADDGVD